MYLSVLTGVSCCITFFGPGNGSPMAINVVLVGVLVVITFSRY